MNAHWGIISIGLTVCIYWFTKRIYKRWHYLLLTPILISPLLLILILSTFHISYSTYMTGAKWLSHLLEPATVAFAVPMYKHYHLLKKHARELLTSIMIGCIVAVLSSVFLAVGVHLDPQVIDSLMPRSVTTPIAMDISQMIGGAATMTAVFVIITGIIGSIMGPLIIRYLPIRTVIAKGAMFGMGAHGVGTSKAFELGELEGTISSLSMIVAAIISVIVIPIFYHFIRSIGISL
jgi:predicted murein hydrolase (TIGR00659 family)